MLTNNNSWQAVISAGKMHKAISAETLLNAGKQKTAPAKTPANSYLLKIVTSKRYSIDDNGGGYEGL